MIAGLPGRRPRVAVDPAHVGKAQLSRYISGIANSGGGTLALAAVQSREATKARQRELRVLLASHTQAIDPDAVSRFCRNRRWTVEAAIPRVGAGSAPARAEDGGAYFMNGDGTAREIVPALVPAVASLGRVLVVGGAIDEVSAVVRSVRRGSPTSEVAESVGERVNAQTLEGAAVVFVLHSNLADTVNVDFVRGWGAGRGVEIRTYTRDRLALRAPGSSSKQSGSVIYGSLIQLEALVLDRLPELAGQAATGGAARFAVATPASVAATHALGEAAERRRLGAIGLVCALALGLVLSAVVAASVLSARTSSPVPVVVAGTSGMAEMADLVPDQPRSVAEAEAAASCQPASGDLRTVVLSLLVHPYHGDRRRPLSAPVPLADLAAQGNRRRLMIVVSDLSCDPCLAEVPDVAMFGKSDALAGVVTLLSGGMQRGAINGADFYRWESPIRHAGGSFAFLGPREETALTRAVERELGASMGYPTTLLFDLESRDDTICSDALVRRTPTYKEIERWFERVTPPTPSRK